MTPASTSIKWRLTRQSAAAAAVVALVGVASLPAAAAIRPDQASAAVAPALPAPTGELAVGTRAQRWVDNARPDPFAAGKPRELVVQLWYPARRSAAPAARYVPVQTARAIEGGGARVLDTVTVHARAGAPAASGRHPVVLFSPGFGITRAFYTALLEDLSSRGFVVVAIDHPYDAQVVEFPDGRLVPGRLQQGKKAIDLRVADVRFVLDQLPGLNAHGILAGRLDLERIGIFGHSVGGAVAAELVRDRRVKAGANLDGFFFGRAARGGVRDPFMLITSPRNLGDPSRKAFHARLSRSQLELTLRRSDHLTFTDFIVLGRPLAELVPGLLETYPVGSIDPGRALTAQRRYLGAFFSAHLLGTPEPLIVRASEAHPEVGFHRGAR
jgi:dienelactone hydrolase